MTDAEIWKMAKLMFADHTQALTGHRWDLEKSDQKIQAKWIAYATNGTMPAITSFRGMMGKSGLRQE